MEQTTQPADGFPYGIDPRQYGLGPLEYDQALRYHREREHSLVMREQRDAHDKAMEWNRAEQDRIAAETELKDWFFGPINSFCKWLGGAFWLVVWAYLIGGLLISLSNWSAERDAKWCLKDVAKCERISKGDFQ